MADRSSSRSRAYLQSPGSSPRQRVATLFGVTAQEEYPDTSPRGRSAPRASPPRTPIYPQDLGFDSVGAADADSNPPTQSNQTDHAQAEYQARLRAQILEDTRAELAEEAMMQSGFDDAALRERSGTWALPDVNRPFNNPIIQRHLGGILANRGSPPTFEQRRLQHDADARDAEQLRDINRSLIDRFNQAMMRAAVALRYGENRHTVFQYHMQAVALEAGPEQLERENRSLQTIVDWINDLCRELREMRAMHDNLPPRETRPYYGPLETASPNETRLAPLIRRGHSGIDMRIEAARDMLEDAFRPIRPPGPCNHNATKFLRILAIIGHDYVVPEESTCYICQEEYYTGDELEIPTRLPCGHVFGGRCLEKWLDPHSERPVNTCPLCRCKLFDFDDEHDNFRADGSWDEPVLANEDQLMDELSPPNDSQTNDTTSPEADAWEAYLGESSHPESDITPRDFLERYRPHGDWADAFSIMTIEDLAPGGQPYTGTAPREWEATIFLDAIQGVDDVEQADDIARNSAFANPHAPQDNPGEQGFLYSAMTLTFFRFFTRGHGAHREDIAAALAQQMGNLYVRLRAEIGVPVMWMERGPPVGFLLDRECWGLLEMGLQRLVEVESDWAWRVQRERMER